MIIWVEGIIGSGKSTLAEALAKDLSLRPYYEPVESNPYLERFYESPKRWAYPMQIHLLHVRYAIQQAAMSEAMLPGSPYKGAVLDRGLPGDRVFAKLHTQDGNISELEFQTYQLAYDIMTYTLRPPSLIVYLDVEPEVALRRVKVRARGAEVGIGIEYLQKLQAGYYDLLTEIDSGEHTWAQGMRAIRVPWNADYQPTSSVIEKIGAKLRSL